MRCEERESQKKGLIIRRKFELLPTHFRLDELIEEISIQDGLDNPTDPRDPCPIVPFRAEAVDPVDEVERSVRT
jgi:hypothetical protein